MVPVKRRFESAAAIASLFLAAAHAIPAVVPAIRQLDVNVAMRDGVRLAPTSSGLPIGPLSRQSCCARPMARATGSAEFPVVRGTAMRLWFRMCAGVMIGGRVRAAEQETSDGDDTLNWIARQPWSDGKIGMIGGSYLGIAQWKAALLEQSASEGDLSRRSGDDDYRDRFYSTGGAMKLGHRLLWMAENMRRRVPSRISEIRLHLPLRTADVAATGQTSDDLSAGHRIIRPTTFWKASARGSIWTRSTSRCFRWAAGTTTLSRAIWRPSPFCTSNSGVHRIMIGPWPHNMSTSSRTWISGREATVPCAACNCSGSTMAEGQRYAAAAQAAGAHLRDGREPLARGTGVAAGAGARRARFTWRAGGHANTLDGDGAAGPRPPRASAGSVTSSTRDDPVPTTGGAVCCNPEVFPWGPIDQRPVEKRARCAGVHLARRCSATWK